ncbi:MAG: 1-deoxy-D-xylulose-5-phosphate synthase [Treponema sp.]|nr:1-deoxy-D-xylulose-5-phosphate synthase [Treponema sp.]
MLRGLFFTGSEKKLLSNIKSPEDLKKLSQKELSHLAAEIRHKIIDVVGNNGGHLASNLGVVELTIALHRVFSTPQDAIVWDVSHQCYPHKLLTGRFNKFSTLRQHGGISGFTNFNESEHDFFISGHSSTSISAALGLLTAWELEGKNGKVVAVIGDGALTGGMAFEALSHAGQLCKNLIVVVNDNQMSIDHNTGALSRYLSRLTMSFQYQSIRRKIDRAIDRLPTLGKHLEKFVFRFKRSLKGLFLTNNLFTDLGFEYVGPLNGHNEQSLEQVLRKVKRLRRPVVVHVVTKKGKGYSPAEDKPELFHGIGPFQTSDGTVEKFDTLSFTEAFSQIILEAGSKNPKIAAITAAMAKGTGLSAFSHKYPQRFFDVGIAEEHAVTFAGGLAAGGMIPVVCIYSTFMQRSVDQLIHDISLQNAHAIFMLDRAGAVPGDGVTHQGIFDIALFRPVPNVQLLSPCSAADLKLCFEYALEQKNAVIIRYPKLSCPTEMEEFSVPVEQGRGIFVQGSNIVLDVSENDFASLPKKVLIVCTGGMFAEVKTSVRALSLEGIAADVYITRFIKPFDEEYFASFASKYAAIVFVEDGVRTGGICESLSLLFKERFSAKTVVLAFEDRFYEQGTRQQVLEDAGLSSADITEAAKKLI